MSQLIPFLGNKELPVQLTEGQFNEFFLKRIFDGSRGPKTKIPKYKIMNYILYVLYTGIQWKALPVEKDSSGKPEVHYTTVYRIYRKWMKQGVFFNCFEDSVMLLNDHNLLDPSVIHGDGTTTAAKRGGDKIGYNGHKKMKGEKVVAFCDRRCNILSPYTTMAGNEYEGKWLQTAFTCLKNICKKSAVFIKDSIISLDSAYDSRANRKTIFNSGMCPNIKENPRGRKGPKKGRPRIFNNNIFKERFRTIERVFAWEDSYRKLLVRFERISESHLHFKILAFTLINLRYFC